MDNYQGCCPEQIVTRTIIADIDSKNNSDMLRGVGAVNQNLVEYKALSRLNGNTRRKDSLHNGMNFKANAIRKLGSTLTSLAIPGDSDPLRSPVRSAVYRTLTPGKPGGIGGSLPGQNRGYRCPEGYQYGGRFTDSRLSTCGAKLFDIPSPLGLAISAIRRAIRGNVSRTTGTDITGAASPSSIIASRAPQIPKVSLDNPSSRRSNARSLVSEIGKYNKSSNDLVRRMVRRDGFVLEPVVPDKVLRAIPDNRDMENATYLRSLLTMEDVGNEELGMLSNTGISSLVYVLPGGSTIGLEKMRKLTVGERRKLGRTVSTAMSMPVGKDPSSRLKFVANEMGDGIGYSESFVGVKNPNQLISGTPKWANDLIKNRKLTSPSIPRSQTTAATSGEKVKLITNLQEAINHISNGGKLSEISPEIIEQILQNPAILARQELSDAISLVAAGDGKWFLYKDPTAFQHLAERYASRVQKSLGLESPEVIFAAKKNTNRAYMRQDIESVIPGSKFNPNIKFNDLDPSDVARIMVADFLTDQRERPMTSIYPVETDAGVRAVIANNNSSGLTDLSKIEITQRMKMAIEDYYASQLVPAYSEYYQALKVEQRIIFMKFLSQLINRARSFRKNEFMKETSDYGISEGEKIHLNILDKLFDVRLESLNTQKDKLKSVLQGGK